MKHYLMYMGMLLFIPAFVAHYVYPFQDLLRSFFDRPDPKNGETREWAVWIVFAFLIWMADSNFDNNAAKWDLCQKLGRYVVVHQLPNACHETEAPDD